MKSTAQTTHRSRLGSWGGSVAVRLPRAAVEKLALKEGADVEITVEDGALVIRSGQPRYLLSDLVRAAKGLAAPAALDDGAIGSEQL